MKLISKITILSISLLKIMATVAVTPALGVIEEYFYYTEPILIKMILTIPSLIIILMSLITSRLTLIYKKKTLCIVGIIFYAIGGMLGGVANSIYILLIFRCLLGIGAGIVTPLSASIIADFFYGEERAKFMGYSTAVSNLGGVIATLLAGFLANMNWRYVFSIYFISFIVLFLVWSEFPKTSIIEDRKLKMKKNECIEITKCKEQEIKEERKLNKRMHKMDIKNDVYKYALGIFITVLIFYSIPTNLAIFIKYEGLGSSKLSGILLSLFTLSSFITGLLFNKIIKVFNSFSYSFSIMLMAIGFFIVSFSNNLYFIGVSVILIGAGNGVIMTISMLGASRSVNSKNMTLALAIINASVYSGKFLSPLLVQFTLDVLRVTSIRGEFYFSFCLSAIYFIILLLANKSIYKLGR